MCQLQRGEDPAYVLVLMGPLRLGGWENRVRGQDRQSCDFCETLESFPVTVKGRFQELFPVMSKA